jgi:hypothetical protein
LSRGSCLRKFPFKILLPTACFAFFLAVIISISVNAALSNSRSVFIEEINRLVYERINIARIYYIFPNILLLRDLEAKGRSPDINNEKLTAASCVLKFSIKNIFIRPTLSLADIVITRAETDYQFLEGFLKNNKEILDNILRIVQPDDFKVFLKRTRVRLKQLPDNYQTPVFDFQLYFHKGLSKGSGTIYVMRNDRKRWEKLFGLENRFLTVHYRGRIKSAGFIFDELSFRNSFFFAQLWGEYYGKRLKFSGYAFSGLRNPQQGYWPKRLVEDTVGKFQFLPKNKTQPEGLYILDINGNISLQRNGVKLDSLKAFINNFPVEISGSWEGGEGPHYELNLSVLEQSEGQQVNPPFTKATLNLGGVIEDGIYNHAGEISVSFPESQTNSTLPEKLLFAFQGLEIASIHKNVTQMILKRCQMRASFYNKDHQIDLFDVKLRLNNFNETLRILEIESPFYGGFLDSRIWMSYAQVKPKITALLFLNNVEANQIDNLLVHFSKVYGKLSTRIFVNLFPEFSLKGKLALSNGQLKNFVFFDWLSDFFNLPSLHIVDFDKVATDFLVNDKSAGLDNVHLSSAKIKMTGYFFLDKNNLVTSQLGLTLARDVLAESPKFRKVLKMIVDVPAFTFDFQLSGNHDAMNFQWQDSALKKKIQEMIPDFIERKIETNIDKGLTPEVNKEE